MEKEKGCSTCGIELTIENTYVKKNTRSKQCKECIKEKQREYYLKNRDKFLEVSKEQYLKKKLGEDQDIARELRREKEFLESWDAQERERFKKEKVVKQLKEKHKCYECKWGRWIEIDSKFICMLPECWKGKENGK